MADHSNSSTNARGPIDQALTLLTRGLTRLATRVARLESTMSNQTCPADTRFEGRVDDDGNLFVDLVRVSTGNRETIAGPL